MGNTLPEVAQQLKDADKKLQLIYAFNGSGKTRLSREFKQLILQNNDTDGDVDEIDQSEPSRNKILYYNAFTEDLFYWDNDLEGDAEPKLIIQPNSFTDWVLKDQGQDQNAIANFQSYANDKLTPHFGEDFKEVTFSLQRGDNEQSGNLKISKGEESNFVWSIFYTLLDQVISILNIPNPSDRDTNQFDQLKYVFIDDPVSSLDENHLIELAVNLAGLIKSSDFDNGNGLRFIITTHNPLFYNVLYSELKPKGGYILSRLDDGSFHLEEKIGASNGAFSYHLHIKRLIELAIEQNNVQRYHFALLRNLYEKTASFFGYKEWSDLLDTVEGDKKSYFNRIIQYSSHSRLSHEEIAEPTEPEKQTVKLLLDNLTNNYGTWPKQEELHG